MEIVETRLVKHDSATDKDGMQYTIELDVEFDGLFDPAAAQATASYTPVGFESAMSVAIGAEVGEGSGVRVRNRDVRLVDLPSEGVSGSYTVTLRCDELGDNFAENPLDRKDTIDYRREGQPVQISRDRQGRIIATYRKATMAEIGEAPDVDAKPIEVFASMPTVASGRYTATISGYREDYTLAIEELFGESFDLSDPNKQHDWKIVNAAPLDLDGIVWPAGTVCWTSGAARRIRINGYSVVEHRWEVEMAPTHDLEVMNAGLWEFNDSRPEGQKYTRIVDNSTGVPSTMPRPLDANGKALPAGYKTSQVVFLKFPITRRADFTYFGWHFETSEPGGEELPGGGG